jgi:hypothetical protein
MKKYAWIFAVMLFLFMHAAFGQQDDRQLFEKKIHHYERLQHTGWNMTAIGGSTILAGSIWLTFANNNYYGNSNGTTDNQELNYLFQFTVSAALIAVGVGLTATGIALGSTGSHKAKSYRNKLNKLSLGVICTPYRQGLSLTYRF